MGFNRNKFNGLCDERTILHRILFFFVLCISFSANALPGTDISLFRVVKASSGIVLTFEKRVTQREGYDNQPAFDSKSASIYFAKNTKTKDIEQTDIWSWSLKTGTSTQLTNTQVKEYSPTPLSIKPVAFSAIIEDNGKQSLHRIQNGQSIERLNHSIEPIGYHTWINSDEIAVFRLGEPHELVVLNSKDGKHYIADKGIGRCMVSKNNDSSFYYVKEVKEENAVKPSLFIIEYDTKTRSQKSIAKLLDGQQDYAWHSELGFMSSNGKDIFQLVKNNWIKLNLKSELSFTGISRMALSPDGLWLAVVHDDI